MNNVGRVSERRTSKTAVILGDKNLSSLRQYFKASPIQYSYPIVCWLSGLYGPEKKGDLHESRVAESEYIGSMFGESAGGGTMGYDTLQIK